MMDRARVMKYTMNALALAEELTGKNILSMDIKKIGVVEMRALIFAGLYDNDRDLTLEQVGDLADGYEKGWGGLMEIAAAALGEAFGPTEKNVKRPAKVSVPLE